MNLIGILDREHPRYSGCKYMNAVGEFCIYVILKVTGVSEVIHKYAEAYRSEILSSITAKTIRS